MKGFGSSDVVHLGLKLLSNHAKDNSIFAAGPHVIYFVWQLRLMIALIAHLQTRGGIRNIDNNLEVEGRCLTVRNLPCLRVVAQVLLIYSWTTFQTPSLFETQI